MRIRHFQMLGVRGLDGLKHGLPRAADTDLIVVHGRYGRGKTTFLDALAAAIEDIANYGNTDSRWDALVGPAGAAKVQIDWELSDDEKARMAVSDNLLSSESILGRRGQASHPVALSGILGDPGGEMRGSVHYLHDSRNLEGALSFGADDAAIRQRLTTRNAKFADLYDVLDAPQYASARALGQKRMSELFPRLEILGLRRFGTSFYPMIRDRETNSERPFERLTSSEKQAFIAALYTAKSSIVDSVMLVDVPELGFGDAGAVDLLQALLRWTTRTQLVVATASDAVRGMKEVAHVVELPS